MFDKLREKLKKSKEKAKQELSAAVFTDGLGKKLSDQKLELYLEDLKLDLIEADVAYEAAEEIEKSVIARVRGRKLKRGIRVEEALETLIRDTIYDILKSRTGNFEEMIKNASKPVKIMFLGINGSGKTTTIAKLAYWFINRGYKVVIAASDTFRAGASEQLEQHANNLNVKLIKHQKGSDAAAVAYDAIAHATAKHKDIVLIDTAGRMQTNKNLLNEMKKIKRVTSPTFTLFVGDALTGSDAINQAKVFDETVGIDGVILCKIDADTNGGTAVSVALAVNKPILFLGTGQKYTDLINFDPDWVVSKIFNNIED